MSNEWREVKLKDICEFKYGKNLPASKRRPGPYNVYGSSDIAGTHDEYLVEGPGVIIGRKGTVGKIQYSKDPFFPIDTTFYLDIDHEQSDLLFLYYCLSLIGFEDMNSDAAVPGLNRTAAINCKINLPPLHTQRKIAAILSAYDDLIENNLKRIKLLEEYTQLTYEEWFVKFRFPHSEEKEFDVNIGLPEGWEIIEFGDFSKIKKGKNITKSTITPGTIPVIAGGLSPAYYHNVANTKSPVITVSASGANAGFTQIHLYDVWASDCSYIDSEMSSYIFFTYCTMLFNKTKILNLKKGAAQPHVYPKDIARIKIIKPDIVTLKSFENFAKVNFQMIGNLLSQNQLLKEARDILLPRLMTGMIEV